MSVIDSFEDLKDQVVKAEGEIMAVAQKPEPEIQTKLDDAKREADQKAVEVKAQTQRDGTGAQSHWQEIQADWDRHRARMRTKLDNAKSGYDLSVAEMEAESAEADALDAISFAASAALEAEYATLDALLARRRAEASSATAK
jgi:hypothetical protein